MIDELYKLYGNDSMLQKILESIHRQAVGVEYTDSVPTKVERGKFLIYRSGTACQVYFQVGNGDIAYIDATLA